MRQHSSRKQSTTSSLSRSGTSGTSCAAVYKSPSNNQNSQQQSSNSSAIHSQQQSNQRSSNNSSMHYQYSHSNSFNNLNSSEKNGSNSDCLLNDMEHNNSSNKPLAICVRNLPVRSTDTSLKDGLFHEYKKHGKVTMVKVIGQGIERYAVICFKKPGDVDKAIVESKDKQFFGCKIEVTPHDNAIESEDNDRPLEAELDEYHPKATRTLFVGNLEKDVSTSQLRKQFDQFGEIIEIDIKKQGTSTYAFIQYSDICSVVKAMRKLGTFLNAFQ